MAQNVQNTLTDREVVTLKRGGEGGREGEGKGRGGREGEGRGGRTVRELGLG